MQFALNKYKKRPSIWPLLLLGLGLLIQACQSSSLPTSKAEIPAAPLATERPLLKFKNGLRSVLEDSKGNLWMGSHNEGLARWDGKELRYFNVNDGLSHDQIRHMQEDHQGNIWFETGHGLSKYDGIGFRSIQAFDIGLSSEWKSLPGDLWFDAGPEFATNKDERSDGLYRYDGSQLHFLQLPAEERANWEGFGGLSCPVVKRKSGGIWAATYNRMIGFQGGQFKIIDDEALGLSPENGYLHVRSLFEDSHGRLWIGNNGIGVLLKEGDSILNFSEKMGLVAKESKHNGSTSPEGTLEHVFAISEDQKGNIWFGDRDTGAWCWNGETMRNYNTQDGLGAHPVWQIYASKSGEILCAMGDGSLSKFDGIRFSRLF